MRNELFRGITLSVGVLMLLSAPMWASTAIAGKGKVSKHSLRNEIQLQSSPKNMQVSLKCITRMSEGFKAAGEQVVEYPDSMVTYIPTGEKVYISRYEYDTENRLVHKVESALMEDGTWAVVKDEKVEYDDANRPVYNEYYGIDDAGAFVGMMKARVRYDQYGNQVYKEKWRWNPVINEWGNSQKESSEYRIEDQPSWEEGYYWDGNDWAGSFRNVYTYNELGMLTNYDEFEWEEGNWIKSYNSAYEYDPAKPKNLLTETQYELDYDTEEMMPIAKALYTYNEKDEYTLILWKAWENDEWVDDQKYQYGYTDGKNTKEEAFSWDGEAWTSFKIWEGSFDSEGRQLTAIYYYPNSTTGQMELGSKYTYAYDGNGNKTLDQLESKPVGGSSDELVMMKKEVWEYDLESRLTLYESYAYNYETGYSGTRKEIVEYTGHGNNQRTYQSYKWDFDANDWTNDMKESFSYDDNNLMTECIRSFGGANAGEWVESEKYDFLYDKNLNMNRQNYSIKDKSGNWVMQQYLLYYYPSTVNIATIEKTKVNIFALGDNLYVSGMEAGIRIWIYDLSGRLIESLLSSGETSKLSLPEGIYLVKAAGHTAKVTIK